MKKLFYLLCCMFAVVVVSCEQPESDYPSEPNNPSGPSDSEEPVNPNDTPQGFVAKPFSVSASKTVTFSPGNLQYHAANGEWRFAPTQLDYVGEGNTYISSTYNGWIDLFGWGTGNNPTSKSTDNNDYQSFVDWGVNKIGNDAPNTWRTLTSDEWEYIINNRSNASNLKGVAQVDGVNGLILLPNDWQCPNGVTFKSGFHNDSGAEYYAVYQSFSASDWAKLETAGAVFLPAAGYYRGGSSVGRIQGRGSLWSATDNSGDNAYILEFISAGAGIGYYDCFIGYSVRLVQDNKNE